MTNYICVGGVLRQRVSENYTDLVTRPTGAAVRLEIEHLVAEPLMEGGGGGLTIIDFSRVGLIDFSCADEVIAKLLLHYRDERPLDDGYLILRGITDAQLDAVEAVLERHRLALVVEMIDGDVRLVGDVSEMERRAWLILLSARRLTAPRAASALDVTDEVAAAALDALNRRRLIMNGEGGEYLAIPMPIQ